MDRSSCGVGHATRDAARCQTRTRREMGCGQVGGQNAGAAALQYLDTAREKQSEQGIGTGIGVRADGSQGTGLLGGGSSGSDRCQGQGTVQHERYHDHRIGAATTTITNRGRACADRRIRLSTPERDRRVGSSRRGASLAAERRLLQRRAHWSSLLPSTVLPPPVGRGVFSLHWRFPSMWLPRISTPPEF